jgi:D-alanyl-D-alanine carboxypeptidase (penicillin-binding protein 5/6)
MKKSFGVRCLNTFCLFTILLSILMIYPLSTNAQSIGIPDDVPYILIESKTGRILAEQNADQLVGPASTTKILTAIVALESGDLDQEMTVSQQAVYDIGRGGMNVGIMAGEEGLTLENMLNLLLIKSANETANIIAENLAPSRKEYVDMMNRRARELGAVNTSFKNPCGKDTDKEDEGHLSTARDIAILARHAMSIPKFREIVSTEYYNDMPITNKHDSWDPLRTTNQFLWHDNTCPYTLDNVEHRYTVIGVKTGYTALAGNNLVTAAVGEDGMELIAVVMHVMQPNKIYGYSKALMRYGFENFSTRTVSQAGLNVKTVTVEGADKNEGILNLVTETEFNTAVRIGLDKEDIETKVTIDNNIVAPVQKGDVLGYVEYWDNDVLLGKVNLVAARSIAAIPTDISMNMVAETPEPEYSYLLLGILLALSFLVLLRMTLRKISRNRKRQRTNY